MLDLLMRSDQIQYDKMAGITLHESMPYLESCFLFHLHYIHLARELFLHLHLDHTSSNEARVILAGLDRCVVEYHPRQIHHHT